MKTGWRVARARAGRRAWLLGWAALPLVLPGVLPGAAWAQTAAPAAPEAITVIGASPLIGGGVDRTLIPANTEVLGTAEIDRTGTPDPLAALGSVAAGVNLDSASGNPYQPSLFFDGFEASPLQGTAQGLAVYLNGVRFNQAFGDTVDWDLVPDAAIGKLNVEGSNPVYGLNALGGAVNVRLKDGFSDTGGDAELSGGSFGKIEADAEYGGNDGTNSFYVAGSERHEEGWRQDQSSDIQNFFADVGRQIGAAEVHATLTLANSDLNGPGTSPVQLIAADPAAQFTSPNFDGNKFVQPAVRFNVPLGDAVSVQGTAYYNYFQGRVVNGNTTNDVPCDDGSGLICSAPGVFSTTRGGAYIPALFGPNPGAYSQLNDQTTNTNGYGAAAQLSDGARLLGHVNHLVAGASFDGADTEFSATALLGGLGQPLRNYLSPGFVLDEPGNVPVRVAITDANAGVFASDTFNVTPALAATFSGRFNFAEVDLADQGGGDLSGRHAYAHFNPAAGLTYKLTPYMTLYGGVSTANRAPTPAELSCAGPQNSCSLANFFVGDPNLKQVVAHTIEAGARGGFPVTAWGLGAARVEYTLSLFRTDSDDDIAFVNAVTLGRAYFANVGQTRRQGVSARVGVKNRYVSASLSYTYTDATYQHGFVEAAGSNPAADANGNITVRPGDVLPGIPRSVVKFTLDATPTKKLTLGADGVLQSGQYLFGDEANLTPKLPGFFVLNVHGSYQVTPRLQVFLDVDNLLNRAYYTYGTFSPTGAVFIAQAPGAANPRAYSPAAPVAAYGGIKLRF